MKRKQIVERIAEQREVPLHTAADWLDSFLYQLIQQLKGLDDPIKGHQPQDTKGTPADTPR